jgi:hypothetical protein
MKYAQYAAVASLIFVSTSAGAIERDEAKAADYIYCGRVAAINMSIASQRGDRPTANGFGQMRMHFLIAATLKSDGDFVKKEIPNAIRKFDAQHPNNETSVQLMKKETEDCSGLWNNEVRSLIGFDKKPGTKDSEPTK